MVVAAEPIGAGNTSAARREETLPVVARELALCRPDPHSAVEAVGLVMVVRRAVPITQNVCGGRVGGPFPAPRKV